VFIYSFLERLRRHGGREGEIRKYRYTKHLKKAVFLFTWLEFFALFSPLSIPYHGIEEGGGGVSF